MNLTVTSQHAPAHVPARPLPRKTNAGRPLPKTTAPCPSRPASRHRAASVLTALGTAPPSPSWQNIPNGQVRITPPCQTMMPACTVPAPSLAPRTNGRQAAARPDPPNRDVYIAAAGPGCKIELPETSRRPRVPRAWQAWLVERQGRIVLAGFAVWAGGLSGIHGLCAG